MQVDRRLFLHAISMLTAGSLLSEDAIAETLFKHKSSGFQLGFVTYLWGKDWDIPTILRNCTVADIKGVELRVDHAHKVMPALSEAERGEVRKQFADSPVKIIGLGTNQQFDYPDPSALKSSIEKTKEFIRLSADVGGSGVKVKPNALHKDVPAEKTFEQIGASLRALAAYAADFGQQLRLEVHGEETQELPNIKKIMDFTDHPNARICWNCNPQDLNGKGFQSNFDLVKMYFGDTVHVRELDRTDYPYKELLTNLAEMDYKGWVLLECHTNPDDKVKSMMDQRKVFDRMIREI